MPALFRRDHPMLKGCRFFWAADWDSVGSARNLMGGASAGAVSSATRGRCGPHSALKFGGSDRVTFGAASGHGIRHGAVTVIARVRVDGDNGTSGQINGFVSAKDGNSTTSTGGFSLYWVKDTYTNTGYNFALYTSGGFYYCTSSVFGGSGEYGKDRVVAGIYDTETKGPRLFVDGVEYTNLAAESVPNPTTVDWNPAVGNLTLADILNETLNLNGAIAWVAIFDRALSLQEVRAWGQDDQWPFVQDDDYIDFTTGATYRSVINVPGPYSGVGGSGVQYVTSLDALAYVSGDITVDPATGESAEYVNVVGVGQTYLGREADILVRYVNKTNVGQVVHLYPSVKYSNLVRVFQRSRKSVDGRADILSAGRYRR